jgi:hypothetical protein
MCRVARRVLTCKLGFDGVQLARRFWVDQVFLRDTARIGTLSRQ